jgi:hypothetical protein
MKIVSLNASIWECLTAALVGTILAFAGRASALEGFATSATTRFGIVGSVAGEGTNPEGFSATQIAPSWAVTAAHIAPPPGRSYSNDFGSSTVAEIISFPTRAPTEPPVKGAWRDDLVLLRLATAIRAPYLPQLADDDVLARQGSVGMAVTLVSNNPDPAHRRFGAAQVAGFIRRAGYPLLLSRGQQVDVMVGDAGSALFLGRLSDSDGSSVLLGVASSGGATEQGLNLGVFTRIGAYREFLDAAVAASGERLQWAATLRH